MDNNKKKVLLISMRGGFGHLKAGEALFEYAQKNLPNIDIKHVDVQSISPIFKGYDKIGVFQ